MWQLLVKMIQCMVTEFISMPGDCCCPHVWYMYTSLHTVTGNRAKQDADGSQEDGVFCTSNREVSSLLYVCLHGGGGGGFFHFIWKVIGLNQVLRFFWSVCLDLFQFHRQVFLCLAVPRSWLHCPSFLSTSVAPQLTVRNGQIRNSFWTVFHDWWSLQQFKGTFRFCCFQDSQKGVKVYKVCF